MWVARDKDNTLILYKKKPIRVPLEIDDMGRWCNSETMDYSDTIELDSDMFPEIKYEDEPKKVFLYSEYDMTNQTIQYKKINDRKQYYLHSVSNSLIDENQVICMEDLNVKGMLRNHKLAESISEMNFGEFRRMLEYKAKWYNRKLVFVDRFYPSSKTCHNCGHVNKQLKLCDR